MRAGSTAFFDRWSDPSFQAIGRDRARAIVTCEPDWYLNTETAGLGAWPTTKMPVRWWQRADNSQVEIEIPNVKGINWERSIESDAATCTVTLTNQWMKTNFAAALANELGMPGFFTFNRGDSSEAQSRWNHETNEWRGRLVGGALLRTYEGHGGFNPDGTSKTREEMIADGDIMLTGVWQVDDVTIGARSKLIELKCRDMMALLLDQSIYPPLVPSGLYPLRYQRWIDETTPFSPRTPPPAVNTQVTVVSASFETSSTDAWYGPNYALHGHRGTDSVDGNPATYALSVGNSGPDKPFATDYFQYNTGGQMVGGIRVTCWQGGYQMYVSVMENGQWQGDQIVPYDPSSLYGTQPTVVDTGADIPYILQLGCPYDTAFEVALPRPYRADRIRISFRHLANSGIGPWVYRAGVREFQALTSATATAPEVPVYWAASYMRDPDNPDRSGYIIGSQGGILAAFGLARELPQTGGDSRTNAFVVWAELNRAADGYWTIRGDGSVLCYGAAGFYGSPKADGVGLSGEADAVGNRWAAICPTPTGNGYWAVAVNGRIRAYGDATPYSDLPNPTPEWIAGCHSLINAHGLIAAETDGTVHVRGSATHLGNWTKTPLAGDDQLVAAVPTSTGAGYWMLASDGSVQEKGDAVLHGENPGATALLDRFDQLIPNVTDTGYILVRFNGAAYPYGTIDFFGSPITAATLRSDGNYRDYADIVKDIVLWSGWFLKETVDPTGQPSVYGNIETTGIYSPNPLPADMFDKRHPIEPIKQLKEIVGYICWVDDEGAFRWETPNWWAAGNYYTTGEYTNFIPEIDERIQITDYTARLTRTKDRSKIIVTTDEPTAGFDDTVTTEYTPSNSLLRGQVIPAMVKVPTVVTEAEQKVFAELIALHLWFARRSGSVTITPNPALMINDQVRLFERVTAETFIHYIRGISNDHDLETGVWTQTLTTNWLGTEDGQWAITAADIPLPVGETAPASEGFVMSADLVNFLEQLTKSPVGQQISVGLSTDVDAPDPGDGAAT